MSKSNRITYRFDRQGNKIEDAVPVHEVIQQPAAHRELVEPMHKNDQKWSFDEHTSDDELEPSNEYEIDIEKLERLIRESSPENFNDIEQQEEEVVQDEQSQQNQERQQQYYVTEDIPDDNGYNMKQSPKKQEDIEDKWNNHHYTGHSYDMDGDEEQQRLYELDRAEEGASEHARSSFEDYAPLIDPNDEKRKPLPWFNSAVSVISAIATGVCIGYLLLSLVFGVSIWPFSALAKSSHTENAITTEQFDDSVPIIEQQEVKEFAPETALQLSEKSYNYHVLQAGVFTQEKTRDEVITSLEHAGFKSHFLKDSSDRYFVYAGVATSAENAAPIQGGIKGIETYRKELTINLPAQIAFTGEGEKLEQYFADSNALIAMYADLVAAQLEQTSFSKIGQAAQDAWQTAYTNWIALSEQIDMNWVEETDKQQALALKEELINAEKQLQSYQSEPKSVYLWNVQSSLVKSVLIQKDWFE